MAPAARQRRRGPAPEGGCGVSNRVKGVKVLDCKRRLVLASVVIGLATVGGDRVEAAEVAPIDEGHDTYRCKSVVSEAIGELRDHLVACYFDPLYFNEIPGTYEVTGTEVGDISKVEAFVRAEPGHGYSWCSTDDAGAGGTLYVGPSETSAIFGRDLYEGQMVYINNSRPGYLDGSCTDFIDPDPSPEGICYDMSNFAGGTLGSPSDSITIEVEEAGIMRAGATTVSAHCYSEPDPGEPGEHFGAEWGGEFAEFCGTCGNPWWDEWMETNDAFPEAWYPGGESGELPDHACAAVEVAYRLDGNELPYEGVSVSDAVIFPGDLVEVEVTYDLDLFPDESPETTLLAARVRPGHTLADFDPIWQDAELVAGSGGATWRIDVSDMFVQSSPLALFELRCSDTNGHSYFPAGEGEWLDDPQENRACFGLSFQYPDNYTLQPGDTVRIGYRMEPGPYLDGDEGVELLEYFVQSVIAGTSVGPIYNRAGVEIGDDAGYDWHVPMDSEGYFEITADPEGDPFDTDAIFILCTDTLGQIRLDGAGILECGRTINCGIGGSPDRSCYQSSGIGLAPSSWVPGLVKMYVCVLEVLVVPDEGVVGEWASDIRDEMETLPPFSFGIAAYDFGSTIADEVSDPTGDACFAFSLPVGDAEADDGACVGADMAVTGPQRTIFSWFLIVPTYLAMLLRGFALLRG